MPEKRFKKSIWVTWIAKLMAGESLCPWSAWFKTHYLNYEKVPSGPELIKWRLDHTRMVNELREQRLKAGEKVFIEEDNRFSFKTKLNLTLDGKPDLIAVSSNGATIYECKSNEQKDSHQVQLMIYLYCIPQCLKQYQNIKLKGCLLYYPNNKIEIPTSLIDDRFVDHFNYWIRILGADTPPVKASSKNECLFCNITKAGCSERIE